MLTKLKLLTVACLFSVCAALPASAQDIKVIKYKELAQLRQLPHDTLYVVNFWATWCKPCIQEMPYFEAATEQYKNQPVRVILVSMDDVEDLDKRVKPFVKKRSLKSTLLLLDERDINPWVDKFEPKWSGAIPLTILFNNHRKQYFFAERELTEEELQQLIIKYKP